jgi:hypothetical protein
MKMENKIAADRDKQEERIVAQIVWITAELDRVKMTANSSGFDCTSALVPIVGRYRADLRKQLDILNDYLED